MGRLQHKRPVRSHRYVAALTATSCASAQHRASGRTRVGSRLTSLRMQASHLGGEDGLRFDVMRKLLCGLEDLLCFCASFRAFASAFLRMAASSISNVNGVERPTMSSIRRSNSRTPSGLSSSNADCSTLHLDDVVQFVDPTIR